MESQFSKYFLVGFAVLCCLAPNVAGQRRGHADDYLYNQTVTISGTVTASVAGKSDDAISVSQGLLFQRVGCRLCLIATRTDTQGRYTIHVGRGKYRVIVRDGTNEGHLVDVVAPDQPRVINATNIVGGNEFNIRLVFLHDARHNMVLPGELPPGLRPR
jgi:hypothetical protein